MRTQVVLAGDRINPVLGHRLLAAGVVSAALALSGLGLTACGDDSDDAEPASQEEIQRQAEEEQADALEDAEEQAESDDEDPSY